MGNYILKLKKATAEQWFKKGDCLWADIYYDHMDSAHNGSVKIKCGDWIVENDLGYQYIYSNEMFHELYQKI